MQQPVHKILCIVQLPPPVHGASLMNEYVVNSDLLRHAFKMETVNMVTANKIESIGKFSFRKVFSSFNIFFRIFSALLHFKPGLVYFTLAPTGPAFYRDVMFVALIKMFRKKIVFHLHGKGIRVNAEKNGLYRVLAKWIFKNSYTIHMSALLKNDLDGIQTQKKFIVSLGIPEVKHSTVPGKSHHQPKLLYLSNYVRSKGIIDLIDAIAIVKDRKTNFHLDLIGKPYDIGIDELNAYVKEKKIDGMVSVCGPRYGEEKYRALSDADVFIFPTYYPNEAFPLVLLEAMQFGLTCISTKTGGIPDMIEDGKTGYLVEQRDVKSLAEKIIMLLNQPDLIQMTGENARKAFHEKYTLSIFEQNLKSAFENILNDRK